MTQAELEARELSRIAREELSSLPRGIGDIHGAIADRVFGALGPPASPVRFVHDTISRGVYGGVRGGLWLGAHAAGVAARSRAGDVPLSETPRGAMAIAALNGLFGDRLEAEGSPLAIPMQVRRIGATVTPHVVVFVHGLGETEYAWGSPNYGDLLDDVTPVFVRFNTGRHISENGAALAALLDELVRDWPVDGRADHPGRPLDGRPRRPQRLPPRRPVDRVASATSSHSARRTWARRSSRPCTR